MPLEEARQEGEELRLEIRAARLEVRRGRDRAEGLAGLAPPLVDLGHQQHEALPDSGEGARGDAAQL